MGRKAPKSYRKKLVTLWCLLAKDEIYQFKEIKRISFFKYPNSIICDFD